MKPLILLVITDKFGGAVDIIVIYNCLISIKILDFHQPVNLVTRDVFSLARILSCASCDLTSESLLSSSSSRRLQKRNKIDIKIGKN